jgi:hypothetical protein
MLRVSVAAIVLCFGASAVQADQNVRHIAVDVDGVSSPLDR